MFESSSEAASQLVAPKVIKTLKEGDGSNPQVLLQQRSSRELAVFKSYGGWPLWKRYSIGRFLASREAFFLNRLELQAGAPRLISQEEPWSLLVEFIEGDDLEEDSTRVLPVEFLGRLKDQISRFHEAGVIHADLGHDFDDFGGRPTNIRITPEDAPSVIDFAGSINRAYLAVMPYGSWLDWLLRIHDHLAVVKCAYRYGYPEKAYEYLDGYAQEMRLRDWFWLYRFGKISIESFTRVKQRYYLS